MRSKTAAAVSILLVAFLQNVWAAQQATRTNEIGLPKPSGSYSVGVRRYVWTDTTRLELDSAHAGAHRRLIVRIWYPAQPESARAPYLPQLDQYEAAGFISAATATLLRSTGHTSFAEARVAAGAQKFPVFIFSPGSGEMEYMYTGLMQELASHGYVAALVVHPGVSAAVFTDGGTIGRYRRLYDPKPAGWDAAIPTNASQSLQRATYDSFYSEVAAYLLRDLAFIIDRLSVLDRGAEGSWITRRLDLNRIVTSGHSYGALAAAEACGRDARVRACVLFDGASFGQLRDEGLWRPLLLFRPAWENDGTGRGISQEHLLGTMRADYFEVNIAGAEHRSFMDAHFLRPASRTTPADPGRVLTIVSAYTRAFLDQKLFERNAPLLEGPTASYPDVHLRVLRSHLPPRAAASSSSPTSVR